MNYNDYFYDYIDECQFGLGEDEFGKPYIRIPSNSRYIKSEDILYEIKKIQQSSVLAESMLYEESLKGMSKEQRDKLADSWQFQNKMKDIIFGQEKYSNEETFLRIFEELIGTDTLYLLDEPEISLSPQNQVKLAEKIINHARFPGCQFLIATHSPFILGVLGGKIYNLDTSDFRICTWTDLDNVRFHFAFFDNSKLE